MDVNFNAGGFNQANLSNKRKDVAKKVAKEPEIPKPIDNEPSDPGCAHTLKIGGVIQSVEEMLREMMNGGRYSHNGLSLGIGLGGASLTYALPKGAMMQIGVQPTGGFIPNGVGVSVSFSFNQIYKPSNQFSVNANIPERVDVIDDNNDESGKNTNASTNNKESNIASKFIINNQVATKLNISA